MDDLKLKFKTDKTMIDRKAEYQDERWKTRAAEIRKLDKNKCVMCGAKDIELHVHHLSYPPPPFHIWDAQDSELVTLCKDCHEKIHNSTIRPILSEDRLLSDGLQYETDYYGVRMVTSSLYDELKKRGYNGSSYTSAIIDWFREKLIAINLEVTGVDEGHERTSSFTTRCSVSDIRTFTLYDESEGFDDYGNAEIYGIRKVLSYGLV